MMRLLKKLWAEKSGATAVEYGLIAVLIGASLISGVSLFGNNLNATFSYIGNTVTTGKP
ncbi:Flp family type IVb pilin [Rhizobium sp. L1K21]|uniref:Flp family type IVb pilin n=1 Tax=Rhizobium sp. L1K21 TaxID=2954933 RepID=UPI002093E474|nr:Flp family type IVb pilin [Rhizobium sp. L1K21]MCO6188200.1 Flp family type IVb pilin [Rhizobium sp. L1K21]